MRKTPPIKIIVHYPQTQQGKQELAQRLADVHADAVVSAINKLDCPQAGLPPQAKAGPAASCDRHHQGDLSTQKVCRSRALKPCVPERKLFGTIP